ncbi:MAG: hypothetical protein ACLVJH_05005 [Faecalibacterium prausnitzii]
MDEDVVVDRLMRECTFRNKRPILKKWASHAHEVMDWFIEAYPELTICDTTRQRGHAGAVRQGHSGAAGMAAARALRLPQAEEFPTFPPAWNSLLPQGSARLCGEANLNKAVESRCQDPSTAALAPSCSRTATAA